MNRLKDRPNGKYINVTAITPTPLGEGKTTTTLGLVEGLSKRGFNAGATIRQPSSGPTMNIKGTAAGGGNALAIPMTEFSLGLTGDINDIMNAHNLAMVALNARMQHERNYDDDQLAARGLKRLDIDPTAVQLGWVIDFCAQGLRRIVMGIGGRMDGYMMTTSFDISVRSEQKAILAVATDLRDLRQRIGRIIVAYDKRAVRLPPRIWVAGAMTAFMRNAINPTLISTVETSPSWCTRGPLPTLPSGSPPSLPTALP